MDDEQSLLEAYRFNNSEEAFAALVRRYIDLVYSAARRQLIDPGLAEDVTQAVFIIFHRKAKSLRAGTIISAWLLTTTHLCARDALKRRARRDKHERRAAQMNDASRSEKPADWDQISAEIDGAITRLSRADRDLLVLRFWDQKSHREIADSIGISENAVAKRTTRALEKLKGVLLHSGTVASTQTLPELLGSHAVQSAPSHVLSAVLAASYTAGASSTAIAKGGMYIMTTTKIKVLVVVIGAVALATTIAIPLSRQTKGPQPTAPVFSASSAQPITLAPPATTQSTNAADSYAEAFKLYDQLKATPGDSALFDQYDASHVFDDQAGAFFDRYAMIVSWVRLGAAEPSCDWGQPSIAQRLPMLNETRPIAIFMNLHARYAAQLKDTNVATDDLLATLALSRHIGARGLLIDKLVEVGIEAMTIDSLAAILPELPKERLGPLSKQLDNLPPSVTGKQMMQAEHDTVLRTAQQQNQLMQVAALGSMDEFYRAIGDAIDQSPDAFDKAADEQLQKLPTIPRMLAKTLIPSLKRARLTMAIGETKRAMLRTAIDILIRGESAVQDSHDPLGSGPFDYVKTARGFELISQYKQQNQPIHITVGE